ncbi:LysE family translocator [Reyranella sp. MMS21-HV4-11]|jgi:threonine/homoserine/homoserine lactone efflux protein|uniref:LysE family translocator n=1 Tax=Reyranella humidisoli TaxID=2849149 RepID=A0ABS6IFC3_9HYPH|nr:LysE family translocator [Reyranella sp. MMS21-HV4-11]MBU8872660.1 LysE family translocator [Reyranella sp. MMS21-HV4-11]
MDLANLALFSAAALAIAVSPGPGIFYVAARTLAGGRGEGLASSFGTGLGGLVHVAAGAVGVSALVMASAEAFTILKLAGALYLVWIGIKAIREARQPFEAKVTTTGAARAFREGILVEALNPKTAAFFLAFLPQFVDPSAGPVWLQFLLLGLISVVLNTAVDVVVAILASRARSIAVGRPTLLRRLRTGAGGAIAALGVALLFARRPASL